MCVVVFLFSFTVLCVICCAHVFLFFVRACLYHCDVYLADVGRIPYINGYYFIFLAHTNVYSVTELTYSGWLLLKWSTVGIGFDGAETNCRIAHVLGILLMISY